MCLITIHNYALFIRDIKRNSCSCLLGLCAGFAELPVAGDKRDVELYNFLGEQKRNCNPQSLRCAENDEWIPRPP